MGNTVMRHGEIEDILAFKVSRSDLLQVKNPTFAKPERGAIRIDWLVHIAFCMWDEPNK